MGAALVAAGILASRLLGVVRNALMARYLGAGIAADAFNASFKIPNILSNLFGEGSLSAAFIPMYSRLRSEGEEEKARQLAGAVFSLLALVTAAIVAVGVLAAPLLVPLIAPGFHGERRALTIFLTRILFPGAAVFVLYAWTLGVLNSHRRFFLGYVAPVAWNVALIAAFLWYGPTTKPTPLVTRIAWASVVGALLQFLVTLPTALRLVRGLDLGLRTRDPNVVAVRRNFVPAFVGRGVAQISSYIDMAIGSLLPVGMPAMLAYAQQIYILPVSLFGMSISAAELPEMSSLAGSEAEVHAKLRSRLDAGLRRIAFFVVPSAVGFLAVGDVIIAALLRSGRFGHRETLFTWGILAGSAVGLLAGTLGRLYSSTYYALHDTRTPLRFAVVRVALTTVLGYLFAIPLPRMLGIDPMWGGAGLTATAGMAAWVEFLLLRRGLSARIGRTGLPRPYVLTLYASAIAAAAAAWGLKLLLAGRNRFLVGAVVLGGFAVVYGMATVALRVPEAQAIARRLLRRSAR
jgi:putative peptidoglycan lipid II flippase